MIIIEKESIKQELKNASFKIVKIIVLIVGIIVLVAASVYFIKIEDGSYKEEDWSNTGFVVNQMALSSTSTKDIIYNDSGGKINLDLDTKVQDIIKKLEEENGNISNYISDKNIEEYLKAFIKAELITQYPDLRSDTEAIKNGLQTNDEEFQGCIQIHRALSDTKNGDTEILTYIDYETFNKYISNADEEATKHFTLDESENLVVAGWTRTTTNIVSNVPDTENVVDKVEYELTTDNINYKLLVKPYIIPFDFLWALVVIGEDEDFAYNVAQLALNSKIILTVQDNLTTVTKTTTEEYENQEKILKRAMISATVDGTDFSTTIGREDEKKPIPYKTEKTVVTETCNTNVEVTYADTWIVEYNNVYSNSIPRTNGSEIEKPEVTPLDDRPYEKIETGTLEQDNEISKALIDALIEVCGGEDEYLEKAAVGNATGKIGTIYYTKFSRRINQKITTTTTNAFNTYVQETPTIIEKTDKTSMEDNFVTLLIKHSTAKSNIINTQDWLYEILERSEKTSDMIDLMKYLFYKATGQDYGITELDFSIFEPDEFIIFSAMYGSTIQEKVWYALREAGYSEYAVAGVLGNIEAESGFEPAKIEYGNGIGFGLCQWSFGRRTRLEEYAEFKGVEASDLQTQIEFLITEVTPGAVGPAQGFAKYQLLTSHGYNGDMWRNAESPEDAAVAFCYSFERPASPDLVSRSQDARKYYEQFKGKTRPQISIDILAACEQVTQTFINRNARYSKNGLISRDIERCYNEAQYIVCTTYVSMVIYKSGALPPEHINKYLYHYTGSGGISNMLEDAGWTKVSPSEAQPGDIINDYGVHTLVYAGDGRCWDQSSCVISGYGDPPSRSTRKYNLTGCEVWRAP